MIYFSNENGNSGFRNSTQRVEGNSVMFKYTYSIDLKNQLMFNAYTMNSNQEDLNSSSGGNIKYKGRYRDWETDRKSTRLNSSHSGESRMPSSA